jgi:hypothetical protein
MSIDDHLLQVLFNLRMRKKIQPFIKEAIWKYRPGKKRTQ